MDTVPLRAIWTLKFFLRFFFGGVGQLHSPWPRMAFPEFKVVAHLTPTARNKKKVVARMPKNQNFNLGCSCSNNFEALSQVITPLCICPPALFSVFQRVCDLGKVMYGILLLCIGV